VERFRRLDDFSRSESEIKQFATIRRGPVRADMSRSNEILAGEGSALPLSIRVTGSRAADVLGRGNNTTAPGQAEPRSTHGVLREGFRADASSGDADRGHPRPLPREADAMSPEYKERAGARRCGRRKNAVPTPVQGQFIPAWSQQAMVYQEVPMNDRATA